MAMNLLKTKKGRSGLLLLILGTLVSSVILLSMVGTAGATHSVCALPAPHTQAECAAIEAQAEADGYAAVVTMAESQSCLQFGPQICSQFQQERDSDVDAHLPVFRDNVFNIGMPYTFSYQENLDALVAAHLALPEHHASGGLVGQWEFNEGSGTAAGDSAGTATGTLLNGAGWTNDTPDGSANALDLDGANDFVNFGDVLDAGNGDLSVSLWYKARQSAAGKNQVLIVKGLTGGANGYELLLHNHGAFGELHWTAQGSGVLADAATPEPSINVWHHVAGVLDRTAGPNSWHAKPLRRWLPGFESVRRLSRKP